MASESSDECRDLDLKIWRFRGDLPCASVLKVFRLYVGTFERRLEARPSAGLSGARRSPDLRARGEAGTVSLLLNVWNPRCQIAILVRK
jgi:hypothetical protein